MSELVCAHLLELKTFLFAARTRGAGFKEGHTHVVVVVGGVVVVVVVVAGEQPAISAALSWRYHAAFMHVGSWYINYY